METTTTQKCGHRFCGLPVSDPSYKWSVEADRVLPFHAACAYAHPDHDIRLGTGSPFTTITVQAI